MLETHFMPSAGPRYGIARQKPEPALALAGVKAQATGYASIGLTGKRLSWRSFATLRAFGMQRARKLALALAVCGLVGACASPPANISRIPVQTGQETSKDGLFTQPVKWEHSKPGCKGDCPTIKVDSIVFPGNPKLSDLVDNALAYMTGIGNSNVPTYSNIAEYEQYFWKTAAPRDSTLLSARTRYRNSSLTVVELDTWQYMTGMAHGISATQFLNWDNKTAKVLSLADVLRPGQRQAYNAALKEAHSRWLSANPELVGDLDTFVRQWPFQESTNYAFTDRGLLIKYDSYQIAPYSAGQPELVIPYDSLRGILKPEFLPS
ncbi:RsiV family protein [Pusillimonas sp. ANT_WB101]|uniref:RsiV family protein n=1 Tax=Pusillimonas sp. ANT_WB101 TaxID=2597356 RepID=UPI0021070755|nr:RsiV family protein [Pusillimonas sp. ANT_WB101]